MHRLRVDSRVARELNRALVFDLLRDRQIASRIGLVRETGLSKATISQIVDEFIAEGLVQTIGPGTSQLGRRPTLIRLEPRARYVIGVELGESVCSAILTDLTGTPLGKLSVGPHAPSAEGALAAATGLIETLLADLPRRKLLGIGIGTPGLVDSTRGVIRMAPDLGWKDVEVGPPLADRFGVPVACLNRAKAAACGEAWSGAGEKVDNLVYVSVSTGISAGIVVNQRLYRGMSMGEGEIGHATVIPDGPLCACGNRGCLQALAAGPAILAAVREQLRGRPLLSLDGLDSNDLDFLSLETVGQLVANGDPRVLHVLDEAAQYIGIAAANLVNTLDPRMLILGGAVIRALPDLVPRIEAVIRKRALSVYAADVAVVPSKLGRDAVPIGAVAFLLDQVSPVVSSGVHASGDQSALTQVVHPRTDRVAVVV